MIGLPRRSLTTTLFIILAVGLFVTQTLSFSIISWNLEQVTRQKMLNFMRQDMDVADETKRHTPAADRPDAVVKFNRGFYDVTLRDLPVGAPVVPAGVIPQLDHVLNYVRAVTRTPDARMVWRGPKGSRSWPSFIIPIDNRQAVAFSADDPLPSLTLVETAVYLLVIFLVIAVISLVAIRLAMRPVAILARAAEEMSRDVRKPIALHYELIELRRVAVVFDSLRSAILRQIEDHAQMLAAVSHDLQTSITRMRLRVELMNDADVQEPMIKDLDFMSAVVKEAMDYGQSADMTVERRPLDVGALVAIIVEELRDLGHDVACRGSISSPVLGNVSQLRRAIGNVVENAVKYGHRCEVELCSVSGGALIYVRDDGPGVPEEMLELIRKPFVRVEKSRSRITGGSGLGLAITDNIIRAHGGAMIIRNLRRGLEISMCIPSADATTAPT